MSLRRRPPTWPSKRRLLLSLVALGAAACGSNTTTEKLDAGHRKYCDAYCADGKDASSGGDTSAGGLDGVGAADRGPETIVQDALPLDSGGSPRLDSAGGFEVVAAGLDSGRDLVIVDGSPSSEVGAPVGGSGGAGGSGGTGGRGSGGAAGSVGGVVSTGGAGPNDAAQDVPLLGKDGAPDLGPDSVPDAVPDLGPDSVPDVGPDTVEAAGQKDVAPDVAGDLADAAVACTAAQVATQWQPHAWPNGFAGMAYSPAGALWATGYFTQSFTIGSATAPYTGQSFGASADTYLASLDPSTGQPVTLKAFGQLSGANGSNRNPAGIAAASDGSVGLVGTFSAEIDFTAFDSLGTVTTGNPNGTVGTAGLDFLTSSSLTNYWAIFNSSGAPVASHRVDVGSGSPTGILYGIGANPAKTGFAICGKAGKLVPPSTGATGLLKDPTGTAPAPAYGGGFDIVVAKIDATGSVVWGKQFGGTGDQICRAVAVDGNGDVVITGTYNGALAFPGLTAFPTVSDTAAALLYVAKLASADGTPMAASTWGTTGKVIPYAVTTDASNAVVVVGSLGANVDFGGGITITDLGQSDAFVVKLATSLSPLWAKSFGDATYDQQAKAVAVAAAGDVYVSGLFAGSLGALNLTSYSNTNSDAFVAHLGSDGAPLCAHVLGDATGSQDSSAVLVAPAALTSIAGSVTLGGAFSSKIAFDNASTAILDTGGGNNNASYILRVAP